MSQFFSSGGQSIGVSASISVLPLKYSGLISFRMDWLDLLAVQGALKSLFQHYNSKASILWHLAFFMVQCSHMHMSTGKTIAFAIGTFVSKLMSLLFNMLSRVCHSFSSKEQESFNFIIAVNVRSDFWSPRKSSLSLFLLLHAKAFQFG